MVYSLIIDLPEKPTMIVIIGPCHTLWYLDYYSYKKHMGLLFKCGILSYWAHTGRGPINFIPMC